MEGFNIYKEGIDLQLVIDACQKRGKVRHLKKGEIFEHEGEPAQWIGYIESGYFKYVVHNRITGKDYSMAFVFNGEMVGDYPFCFYGDQSDVDIVAGEDSTVYVMDGKEFNQLFEENIDTMRLGKQYAEHLFIQAYTRLLNFYRTDAPIRYKELLQRCPSIVMRLPLQEIASYLHVTPVTVSKIRKELLEKERGVKLICSLGGLFRDSLDA